MPGKYLPYTHPLKTSTLLLLSSSSVTTGAGSSSSSSWRAPRPTPPPRTLTRRTGSRSGPMGCSDTSQGKPCHVIRKSNTGYLCVMPVYSKTVDGESRLQHPNGSLKVGQFWSKMLMLESRVLISKIPKPHTVTFIYWVGRPLVPKVM